MSAPPTDARLLAKYGGGAPRYTSYPTAVQFSSTYAAEDHADALSHLNPGAAVSVYAHLGADLSDALERLYPARERRARRHSGSNGHGHRARPPFLRAACLAFDAYFDPAAQRHSVAI